MMFRCIFIDHEGVVKIDDLMKIGKLGEVWDRDHKPNLDYVPPNRILVNGHGDIHCDGSRQKYLDTWAWGILL